MGRDVENSAGLAPTIEGTLIGYTLCLGLGNPQPGQPAFHNPSPLLTPAQAETLWEACDADPIVQADAEAAMTGPFLAWFQTLDTAMVIGGRTVNLQHRALQAIRISHRPLPPRLTASGGLHAVV